ncbi:MAG: hypothetical protein KGI25_10000, partial [Thaumarchaeota archaeon]|nr:hypothetical protein [Nitrososphaerota archaeon]
TYSVTGTIPQEMMASPAITYWVDVHNTAQKTTDSDQYTVGVTPQYPVTGNLQMDMTPTRAEGTSSHPTAYFTNNSTGSIYGSVSLIVDGSVVYTSPATVFGTGQTAVTLDWKAPTIDEIKDHQVYAEATVYGQSFDTVTSTLTSFPSIKTLSITNGADIASLTEGNNTVADPVLLYSSFHNQGTMRYHLTAPDGTCVIGGQDNCLVTKSTMGLRGDFNIVTVGQQTFLVRYSGPDSPLERFSITSSDPIVGKWTVGIDSQSTLLPLAQAASDVFLKVKYMDTDATPITLQSK